MAVLSTTAALVAIGVGAVLGLLTPCFLLCCIHCLGFGSDGVVAGSLAACVQSSIGGVSEGSLFACCQSWGAAGCHCAVYITLAALGAVAGYYTASAVAAAL